MLNFPLSSDGWIGVWVNQQPFLENTPWTFSNTSRKYEIWTRSVSWFPKIRCLVPGSSFIMFRDSLVKHISPKK